MRVRKGTGTLVGCGRLEEGAGRPAAERSSGLTGFGAEAQGCARLPAGSEETGPMETLTKLGSFDHGDALCSLGPPAPWGPSGVRSMRG